MNKLDREAPFVTNPPPANFTRRNPPICNPQLSIAITSEQIMQFQPENSYNVLIKGNNNLYSAPKKQARERICKLANNLCATKPKIMLDKTEKTFILYILKICYQVFPVVTHFQQSLPSSTKFYPVFIQ